MLRDDVSFSLGFPKCQFWGVLFFGDFPVKVLNSERNGSSKHCFVTPDCHGLNSLFLSLEPSYLCSFPGAVN